MPDYLMSRIVIKNKDGSEKEGLVFRDGLGYMADKETGLKIIKRLNMFYNLDNASQFIENNNNQIDFRKKFLIHGFKYDKENKVYLLKEPSYDKRKPKLKVANSWGFTCAWCGKKWSSKDNEYYYRAYFESFEGKKDGETVCSEDCAKLISKEIQVNWLKENDFYDLFRKKI